MDDQVVWTDLTPQAIADLLADQHLQVRKRGAQVAAENIIIAGAKHRKSKALKTVPHRTPNLAR